MKKSEEAQAIAFSKRFLDKKRLYEPKKDPVWVYLEREMQENIAKKPYNKKVGDWLKFLRDLKLYYRMESKKQERILKKEVGPPWYIEMSGLQKEVLKNLSKYIHYDLIDDIPIRTRRALSALGITRSMSKSTLLRIMKEAVEDASLFLWSLYTVVYKKPPSELRGEYDMDAIIMMSAIASLDMEECIASLNELMRPGKKKTPIEIKKKDKKATKNTGQFGMYLDRIATPRVYCRHKSPQRLNVRKPQPNMDRKISIRSDDSYEHLRLEDHFLENRRQRCIKAKMADRICNYKFWEPPIYLLSSNLAMREYYKKLRILDKPAKVCHVAEYANIQFNVGPVVIVGGKLRYLLHNMVSLPTGYIAINGGIAICKTGERVNIVAGFWKYPVDKDEKCDATCDCIKWEKSVKKYLEDTKCECGHFYDFNLEGKSTEKYFYPPTKHWPMWFDEAKVFQMDPMEDFVKETVKLAERSQEPTPDPSHAELSAGSLNPKILLQSFLADLSNTALMIPHLPKAEDLNNLLELVRKRFNGDLTPEAHKLSLVQSMRRWLWLSHMDFRKRAYLIPFTQKELAAITWADRRNLQYLFEYLLRDFESRNRLRQLEQSRLWWSTMKFDVYPSQAFLDIFFTYMPGRLKDTYVFNPFNAALTPRDISKACPLE